MYTTICFDVGTTGVALYFQKDGLRGRKPIAYGSPPEDTACEKIFTNKRNRSGGIFSFFCEHGHCWGGLIIPHAEGCRDPFMVTCNQIVSLVFMYLCVCSGLIFVFRALSGSLVL